MRKYVKSFVSVEGEDYDIDSRVNSWLDSKHDQVGKTIARFEMLYIEPVAVVETTNTSAYTTLFIIYTEMRL